MNTEVEKKLSIAHEDLLKKHYDSLSNEIIEEEVGILKNATNHELYELIGSDCLHYLSIISNYPKENLQTQLNCIIHRINGNLIVKFKINPNDRFIEVGFTNDGSTDDDTLEELKNMISVQLSNYEKSNEHNREHIIAQLDNDTNTTHNERKNIKDDNNFSDISNISSEQLHNAGYSPVPDKLKHIEKQLRNPIAGISEDLTTSNIPHVDKMVSDFESELSNVHISNMENKTDLTNRIENYNALKETLTDYAILLNRSPIQYQPQIHQMICDLSKQYDVRQFVYIIIELLSEKHPNIQITDRQRDIIKKYNIDMMKHL